MTPFKTRTISRLKKQLFKSISEADRRSFNSIYSSMRDPNDKNWLMRLYNTYYLFFISRTKSEKGIIKRIFKEIGLYYVFQNDIRSLGIKDV